MGSRSGSIDPGILLYLMRERGYTGEQLDEMLNKSSGLKGIAGTSDMRQVIQNMQEGDELATLAFQMFVHRLRTFIGAMLASLDGLDALVFAGGIGEHSPDVRAAACEPFGFLGIALDEQKNAHASDDGDIAAPACPGSRADDSYARGVDHRSGLLAVGGRTKKVRKNH